MGPDKTVYDRDYVIDYTSAEWNDLAEYNEGHYQWQWEQTDSEESAAPLHELYHLYNVAGERVQVTTDRFSQWGGENILYKRNVHEDIMGSAVYYTQQDTGYIKNKHEYSTWGNNTKAPTYNYDPEYRSTEPYYTGHPYDGSLNLYYAEARFYDPETGSWLSKDPAGIAGGMNLYQYCNSNPASFVDVNGEEAVVLTILLLLAAGVIVYEALDATVWNPNVNPFHPANQLPSVPWGYKPEVLPPLDLSFPAIPNDRPLIVPGPIIDDAELADMILDTIPATIPGLDAFIDIFPVAERYFFQNILCTEGRALSGSNGIYERADYHGKKNNTVKNKAPNQGQEALDNSISIGSNTTRRVGISDGEIVVLDETMSGIFHGHVRSWDELSDKMKAALRKEGLVDKKGNIKK